MKKIIGWKVYNTETSEEIVQIWNWLSSSDFKHFEETLYKTKKWQYFLLKNWWPLSKYWYSEWNNRYWDIDIEILDFEQILKWFEESYKYFWKSSINSFFKEFWDQIDEW